jgi:hypothetical protein
MPSPAPSTVPANQTHHKAIAAATVVVLIEIRHLSLPPSMSMRCPAAGKLRLRSCRRELLHDARPFASHPSHLLNRSLKALELALQILDGGLNPVAERAPATRKKR